MFGPRPYGPGLNLRCVFAFSWTLPSRAVFRDPVRAFSPSHGETRPECQMEAL
jgi:hypothetical protein